MTGRHKHIGETYSMFSVVMFSLGLLKDSIETSHDAKSERKTEIIIWIVEEKNFFWDYLNALSQYLPDMIEESSEECQQG
jgi:hypothetical protein